MRTELLLHCCPLLKKFLYSTHRIYIPSPVFFSISFSYLSAQIVLSLMIFFRLFFFPSLFFVLFLLMPPLSLMPLSSYFYSRFFAVLLLHALANDRPVLNSTFVFRSRVARKEAGAFDAPCEYRGFAMRWYS